MRFLGLRLDQNMTTVNYWIDFYFCRSSTIAIIDTVNSNVDAPASETIPEEVRQEHQ